MSTMELLKGAIFALCAVIICGNGLSRGKNNSSKEFRKDLWIDSGLLEGDIQLDLKNSTHDQVHNNHTLELRPINLLILRAIRIFNNETCVQWTPRFFQNDYVFFEKANKGCYSLVGRKGGRQVINLGVWLNEKGVELNCFLIVRNILHEMMHAAGFWHEQSRFDRDVHFRVILENIEPKKLKNFNKRSPEVQPTFGLPFDFYSIMLYPMTAFSKNGNNTMQAIEQYFRRPRNITTRKFLPSGTLSHLDRYKVNRFYNCNTKPHKACVFNQSLRTLMRRLMNSDWGRNDKLRNSTALMNMLMGQLCPTR